MHATQDAVKNDTRVPLGHIIVCDRWQNTDLAQALQGRVRIMYQDNLGVVDFHPSQTVGVVYLSEADIIGGSAYKRKLVKMRKANKCKGVILAEKTAASNQYYQKLQSFVMLDLGFVLTPVASQTEAGGLLVQMVNTETKSESNPFRKKTAGVGRDEALLECLQCVPKLGVTKAKALLQKFNSLEGICNSSVEDLAEVLGNSGARHVKDFLNNC